MSADGNQPTQIARRQPQAGTIITGLNRRLDDYANKVRQLEDREVYLQALVDDYESETGQHLTALSQLRAENLILRGRLDIADTDPIELTDAEVTGIGDAQVMEVPDP